MPEGFDCSGPLAGGPQAAAGALLEAERKTESSLKRLNRNRAGEGALEAAAGASNTDKMTAQLFLDVQVSQPPPLAPPPHPIRLPSAHLRPSFCVSESDFRCTGKPARLVQKLLQQVRPARPCCQHLLAPQQAHDAVPGGKRRGFAQH